MPSSSFMDMMASVKVQYLTTWLGFYKYSKTLLLVFISLKFTRNLYFSKNASGYIQWDAELFISRKCFQSCNHLLAAEFFFIITYSNCHSIWTLWRENIFSSIAGRTPPHLFTSIIDDPSQYQCLMHSSNHLFIDCTSFFPQKHIHIGYIQAPSNIQVPANHQI